MTSLACLGVVLALAGAFAAYRYGFTTGFQAGKETGYGEGKRDGAKEGSRRGYAVGFDRGRRRSSEGDEEEPAPSSTATFATVIYAFLGLALAGVVIWNIQTVPQQSPERPPPTVGESEPTQALPADDMGGDAEPHID